jgi:hypothetical protein
MCSLHPSLKPLLKWKKAKVVEACQKYVDDICGGVVGKVDGESGGAAHFCTCLRSDC